jgi:hypothetical protein
LRQVGLDADSLARAIASSLAVATSRTRAGHVRQAV